MAGILRGGIYWCELEPGVGHEQSGKRPVLVISHAQVNDKLRTAIVIPLTSSSQRAGFPLTMELNDTKLSKKSWLKISQVRTVSIARLSKLITKVNDQVLVKAISGLTELIS